MLSVEVIELNQRCGAVAESVLAVQLQAYAFEAKMLGVAHFPPLDRIVEEVQNSNEVFLGVKFEQDLIGVVSFEEHQNRREFEIVSLVVKPSWHRMQVATRLLEAALERAGNSSVVVSTGAMNLPAITLYSKFGFSEYAREIKEAEKVEIVHLRKCAA